MNLRLGLSPPTNAKILPTSRHLNGRHDDALVFPASQFAYSLVVLIQLPHRKEVESGSRNQTHRYEGTCSASISPKAITSTMRASVLSVAARTASFAKQHSIKETTDMATQKLMSVISD